MAWWPMDRAKLAALLTETKSDYAYEVVKAMKAANTMVEGKGLTWLQVLSQSEAFEPQRAIPNSVDEEMPFEMDFEPAPLPPKQPPEFEDIDRWKSKIKACREKWPNHAFLLSVETWVIRKGWLSSKQQQAIDKFYRRT